MFTSSSQSSRGVKEFRPYYIKMKNGKKKEFKHNGTLEKGDLCRIVRYVNKNEDQWLVQKIIFDDFHEKLQNLPRDPTRTRNRQVGYSNLYQVKLEHIIHVADKKSRK